METLERIVHTAPSGAWDDAENRPAWLELRAKDVTSTEAAALFGESPYCGYFELWHRKQKELIVEIEDNERMKWGRLLQDTIAGAIAEEQGWKIARKNDYISLPQYRLGSSFDFEVELPSGEKALLEIKNVDGLVFRNSWRKGVAGVEAPVQIECQLQQEMLVGGYTRIYLGALVGGNKLVLVERAPSETIQAAIIAKAQQLWASIQAGDEPSPNWIEDAEYIMQLFGKVTPKKVLDARDNPEISELARLEQEFLAARNEAEAQQYGVKAQIVVQIGDAEKVYYNGGSIVSKVTKTGRSVTVYHTQESL